MRQWRHVPPAPNGIAWSVCLSVCPAPKTIIRHCTDTSLTMCVISIVSMTTIIIISTIIIIRSQMWPIATDGIAWSVCLSVCLSVGHMRELCKKRLN